MGLIGALVLGAALLSEFWSPWRLESALEGTRSRTAIRVVEPVESIETFTRRRKEVTTRLDYSFTVDGAGYAGRSTWGGLETRGFKEGGPIVVLYAFTDPSTNRPSVLRGSPGILGYFVLLGAVLVVLPAGVLVFRFLGSGGGGDA